jgi:hypothetical protein
MYSNIRRSLLYPNSFLPTALLLFCSLALAQHEQVKQDSSQATHASRTSPLPLQDSSENTGRQDTGDLAVPKENKKLRGDFVFAPIPISSPALGSGVIPVFGYIFPLRKNDKASPPSVIGAAGLITDNGSRAFAVGGQLFIKQDTYRVTATFVQGNLNYDLYGIGAAAGNAGVKLPLMQEGAVFLGEFLRRLKWRFFAGPRVLTGHSDVTLRSAAVSPVPAPPI